MYSETQLNEMVKSGRIDRTDRARLRIEQQVGRRIIEKALAQGWTVEVWNGGDTFEMKSTNYGNICDAMCAADEDELYLFDAAGQRMGWIKLIYGNDVDVISDYSIKLEEFLKPINDWVETL